MRRKWIWVLLVAPLVASCGYNVQETVSPVVPVSDLGEHKRVVILPFADYTQGSSPQGYWRRNILVMEALQDELHRHNFKPAMQEDVINYMLERGIIKETENNRQVSMETTTLLTEMESSWSDEMKGELARAIYQNVTAAQGGKDAKYWNSERLIALDVHTLRSLGNAFAADYVVRGRVVEFATDEEDSFNPMQTGILPFFFKFGQRTVFGVAKSDEYEMIDKMAIGALMGSGLAPSDYPLEGDTKTTVAGHPRFGAVETFTDSLPLQNAMIWGGVGAAAAHLAHKGGKVNRAAVQLRMVVQDAATGEIVWANRAEVRVTPQSAYADQDHDTLLRRAIQHATSNLVRNFLATRQGGFVVRRDDSGTLSTYPRDPVYSVQ